MPSEEVSSCATPTLHQGALIHTTNAHQNTSTQLHVNATIAHKNEHLVHVNTTNDGKSFTSSRNDNCDETSRRAKVNLNEYSEIGQ